MHIEINDNTLLSEIQEVFSNFYPYLRLEFYKRAHDKYEASEPTTKVDEDLTIGDVKQTHVSGLLEIQPSYKVSDVEREFVQRFGLSVQVLKKEKNNWEQTTGMDDFTLKELNQLGRNSSDEFIVEDYEEGFENEEET